MAVSYCRLRNPVEHHILSLAGISRRFGLKQALDEVDAVFHTGEIHVLLGENGAGKSTLAGILTGSVIPDSGNIYLDGAPVAFAEPKAAAAAGIGIVHQRPLLVPELSVLENVMLGAEPARWGIINRAAEKAAVARLKARFDIGISVPDMLPAAALSADGIFYTALLAAVSRNPRFLILDEPAAPLDSRQRQQLYSCLKREISDVGTGIIVITHNLQESVDYADAVTVLRKGKVVLSCHRNGTGHFASAGELSDALFPGTPSRTGIGTVSAGGSTGNHDVAVSCTEDSITAQAESSTDYSGIGQESALYQEAVRLPGVETPVAGSGSNGNSCGRLVFAVNNLTCRPVTGAAIFNVSFQVWSGSITLIAGQREGGLETLENITTGMQPCRCTGTYILGDREMNFQKHPLRSDILRMFGTGIVPFNRAFRGANPRLPVEVVAGVYESPQKRRTVAGTIITEAGITALPEEPVFHLSGGMLQRLILARELYYKPQLLILSEPFQGLDHSASSALISRIQRLAAEGAAVLVLTTESGGFAAIASRQYVLAGGFLSGTKISL